MWFRGDRVEVITGEDKGKQVSSIKCTFTLVVKLTSHIKICFQGIIKIIVQERNWIYVDGLNLTYEIRWDDFFSVNSLIRRTSFT